MKIPVQADFGFFLLMSIFLLLNQNAGGFILAVGFHELAHLIMMKIFHVKIRKIFFEFWGIRIEREETPDFYSEMMINLAGPAANFLLALIFYHSRQKFSALNCAIGLLQLCPLPSLDGGQALMDFLQQRFSLEQAENICEKVENTAFVLAAAAGSVLFAKEKNPMLLLLALGIFLEKKTK